MPYGRLIAANGDDGAANGGCDTCADASSGAALVDAENDVWLSTPSASEIDGSDWRVVCLASCSSTSVRRDSDSILTPACGP